MTTERFKISTGSSPLGWIANMDPATKARLIESAKGALIPGLAVGGAGALLAGATADEGEGLGDAVSTGLKAGAGTIAAGIADSMLMGGKTPLSHRYQRGIGSDFRNIANKGREAMGLPTVNMPNPPKVASADKFKIADYADPYGRLPSHGHYGQYGEDDPNRGTSMLNTALLLGAGGLGAAGLQHYLMNAYGPNARAYQLGLGKSVRDVGNKIRGGLGVPAVAQPAHPAIRRVQDAMTYAKEMASAAPGMINELSKPAAAIAGAGAMGYGLHQKGMEGYGNPEVAKSPAQELYQATLGGALRKGGDVALRGASSGAKAVASASKKVKGVAERGAQFFKKKAPTTAKAAMLYEAGQDAACDLYAV